MLQCIRFQIDKLFACHPLATGTMRQNKRRHLVIRYYRCHDTTSSNPDLVVRWLLLSMCERPITIDKVTNNKRTLSFLFECKIGCFCVPVVPLPIHTIIYHADWISHPRPLFSTFNNCPFSAPSPPPPPTLSIPKKKKTFFEIENSIVKKKKKFFIFYICSRPGAAHIPRAK